MRMRSFVIGTEKSIGKGRVEPLPTFLKGREKRNLKPLPSPPQKGREKSFLTNITECRTKRLWRRG
jgi:hypothetical protein